MVTTYVGFYRPTAAEVTNQAARDTGRMAPGLAAKVNGFPAALPATCKLVGSWAISGGQVPGVLVVEAESFADLQHVNLYYAGWLEFDWHPTAGVPRDN
ncbi:hypothetical protein AYO38_10390 [bacterium SCGC AG-212-C10]|nr:hypothetical protein AYO38_10390 [bacterium SCGC AG-212-C10]